MTLLLAIYFAVTALHVAAWTHAVYEREPGEREPGPWAPVFVIAVSMLWPLWSAAAALVLVLEAAEERLRRP